MVKLKNKIANSFISKMSLFRKSRGVAILDKQRESLLLLGFRRKLGRVVLNKRSLGKNKSSRLRWFLMGCKHASELSLGREGSLMSRR